MRVGEIKGKGKEEIRKRKGRRKERREGRKERGKSGGETREGKRKRMSGEVGTRRGKVQLVLGRRRCFLWIVGVLFWVRFSLLTTRGKQGTARWKAQRCRLGEKRGASFAVAFLASGVWAVATCYCSGVGGGALWRGCPGDDGQERGEQSSLAVCPEPSGLCLPSNVSLSSLWELRTPCARSCRQPYPRTVHFCTVILVPVSSTCQFQGTPTLKISIQAPPFPGVVLFDSSRPDNQGSNEKTETYIILVAQIGNSAMMPYERKEKYEREIGLMKHCQFAMSRQTHF